MKNTTSLLELSHSTPSTHFSQTTEHNSSKLSINSSNNIDPDKTSHASTLSKIGTVFHICFTANLRDWVTLFFTFAFPALLLCITIPSISNSVPSSIRGTIIAYVTSNLLVFCMCYTGFFSGGTQLSVWKHQGLLDILKRLPISPSIIILGQLICGTIFVTLECILLILIGVTFGATFTWKLVIGVAPLFAGFLLFFSIGIILGLTLPNTGAVSGVANAIILPLAFVGGLMTPLNNMPHWLQTFSSYTPLHQLGQSVLYPLTGLNLSTNPGTWSNFWIGLIYTAVLAIIFTIAAVRVFRWK